MSDLRPLHVSEMRAYQRCPREWEHAYRARRVPRTLAEPLYRGRWVHLYLEAWWGSGGQTADLYLPEDPIARACCIGYAARYGKPDLEKIETELPFTCEVGGVPCAGTVDVLGIDASGELTLYEHKTTSADISAGGSYWREVVHCDSQVTMYLSAFPGAKLVYDVIRKPQFRKLRAGKLNEETDEELCIRCVQDMAKDPERYFARFTIARLEPDHVAFARDVASVDAHRSLLAQPRNTSSCYSFGRECPYFAVCHMGQSLSDNSVFQDQEEGR